MHSITKFVVPSSSMQRNRTAMHYVSWWNKRNMKTKSNHIYSG